MIFPLLLTLFFGSSTQADILFIGLNIAPAEISAAKEVARIRGERIWVFPEMTPELEKQILDETNHLEKVQKKYLKCKSNPEANCEALSDEVEKVYTLLIKLTEQVEKVSDETLPKIVEKIAGQNPNLTALVISGHSGGTGFFAGSFGTVEAESLSKAFAQFPTLLPSIRSILLWGCYSGTLNSMQDFWRKKFPSTPLFAGYEQRAPLGTREASGRYLKSLLLNETKLLAAAPPKDLHRAFKKLELVSELDGTAIIHDHYMTYDAIATVDEMLKRCQTFDESMLTQFDCYEEGKPGCENPPANHQGPLRKLYNFLQVNRHCAQGLQEKYPKLPSLEYIVRLIFLDNIKLNLKTHYEPLFKNFSDSWSEVNLPAEISMESFVQSTRAQEMAYRKQANMLLNQRGLRDGSITDNSSWRTHLLVNGSLSRIYTILGHSEFRTSTYTCVPFSWVEPNAKEKDTCGLGQTLARPLANKTEEELVENYFDLKGRHIIPGIFYFGNSEKLPQIKNKYIQNLEREIKIYEKLEDLSDLEVSILALERNKLQRTKDLEDRPFGELMLSELPAILDFFEKEIIEANAMAHNEAALASIETSKKLITQEIEIIRKLLEHSSR